MSTVTCVCGNVSYRSDDPYLIIKVYVCDMRMLVYVMFRTILVSILVFIYMMILTIFVTVIIQILCVYSL